MEKIVNRLIYDAVEGVDKYISNGSIWLIFTDDKKWVIELTKDGTLWYNYNFFKGLFAYTSMDVVENQHYITKWVEDTIINGVKYTSGGRNYGPYRVEDTIQNGVKETHSGCDLLIDDSIEGVIQNGVKETKIGSIYPQKYVEKIMQNGVKETHRDAERHPKTVEDAIQNGVKKTYSDKIPHEYDWSDQFTEDVEYTIQNGVKHTEKSLQIDGSCVIEDVLKNGIKETHDDVYHHTGRVEGVIKNGVKKIEPMSHIVYNPMDFSAEYRENRRLPEVTSVLEKGIKEVQPLPAQDGNRDWGNYYHRKKDRTKPHTQYVNDVIENGKKFKYENRTNCQRI